VRRLVLGRSALMALIGIGAGLAAAASTNQLVQSQLYGVRTADPVTWLVTPVILIGTAMWVSRGPARRAMRIDPAVALRNE
jgi:putative ABC transport system permease protein